MPKIIDLELKASDLLFSRVHSGVMLELPNQPETYYLPFRGEEKEYVALYHHALDRMSIFEGSYADMMWDFKRGEKPQLKHTQPVDTTNFLGAITGYLTKCEVLPLY